MSRKASVQFNNKTEEQKTDPLGETGTSITSIDPLGKTGTSVVEEIKEEPKESQDELIPVEVMEIVEEVPTQEEIIIQTQKDIANAV